MLYTIHHYMQRIALLIALAASSAFAVPHPYPVAVDSQTRSVPALEMYQAEPFTVRATFRSGGIAEDVSTTTPFMYWATSAGATNYVTSSWARVNGGITGVVDFTFSAAAVNTNGDLIYGIGAGSTFRQGALKIRSNPFAAGVASPTFTLSTNLAGVTFINYPWLDSVALYESTSNAAAVVGNGIRIDVDTNDVDYLARDWAQAASNLAAGASSAVSLTAISNLVVGTSNELSGRIVSTSNRAELAYALADAAATGTPVYAESDPLFIAASNALLTKAQASSIYATGTPIYAVSGLGTDDTARAWALGASNRADAAYVLAANAATGTPIYSVAGLATGTPIYSAAGLATGTPLYVENNPSLAALSNGLASAHGVGSNALAVANAASNLAAGAAGWGNHATNGYAVNGQNITGRWVAVGAGVNINDGAFVGGGSDVYALGSFSFVGGGFENEATGAYSTVVGGGYHRASGAFSFVGGGSANRVYGNYGSILGGSGNTIYGGNNAIIGGGYLNVAEGDYSAIQGGFNNTASTNAFAAGTGAKATNSGSFVLSAPGTTNATFGSRGDNSFAGRFVGGVYFLAPDFWIQDTNGNTIARFSATNTTISGNLNLTGYATTGAVNSQVTASGLGATNFGLAIGAGATSLVAQASAQGTNFALAVGAGNSNFTLQAWSTASNGLATAKAAQVQASNINAGAWSQVATNDINMNQNAITNLHWMQFSLQAVPDVGFGNSIYVSTAGNLRFVNTNNNHMTIATSSNMTSLGVQTVQSYNAALTNTLWRWSGFIQGGSGQRGNAYQSNGFLYVWSDESNAYGRVQLTFD